MAQNLSFNSNLSLSPLGAGDLIDRAVRFYRGNFWTFVIIAAPPVVFGTLISVAWLMIGRGLFPAQSYDDPFQNTFYYLFVWLGSILIWLVETVATLAVMGGASRNFVRHLLFGDALKFVETYRNTWRRLPGLIFASAMIAVILSIVGIAVFYFGVAIAAIAIVLVAAVFPFSPFIIFALSFIIGAAVTVGALWLFFLVASRFAYVPQIMLVEGLGVFAAVGRSASLASGNVKRLAALFIFTTFASYSALCLLYIPLLWAAWANGIQVMSFNTDTIPAWYSIANQVIWQASLILLMPVWMIGLCLLYVDERVRHEGYDIELMAAQRLGEIPAVPQDFINPLQPALVVPQAMPIQPKTQKSPYTTLGLK